MVPRVAVIESETRSYTCACMSDGAKRVGACPRLVPLLVGVGDFVSQMHVTTVPRCECHRQVPPVISRQG